MQEGCDDPVRTMVVGSVGQMGDVAEVAQVDGAGPAEATVRPADGAPRPAVPGRRRFTVAAMVGVVVAAVPFLWNLWGTWQTPDLLRTLAYQTNFYDIQARAMVHGHLAIPPGSIGVEAFVVRGHSYTYFGLFPSILRMPFVEWAPSLFGRLTTPSILVAWLVSALFVTALAWRVRVMVRGEVALGWSEAISFGAFVATVQAGSVFLLLAATPYVFNEDLAWSIALTVGCLYVLAGIVQRPTWGRVVALGLLLTAADLDRLTTGWAAIIGTLLVAGWFAFGRGGAESRRWWWPLGLAAGIALTIGCAVNVAKFGTLFGLPITDQLYTQVNPYRRAFLAAHHGSEVDIPFVWSNLWAYLRPDGIRFTSVFPFVTLPASPAASLGGVLFDRRYRTASVPASMPLLFLLSCWGLVTAFRPRPPGLAARTRLLLLAAGGAAAALLIWGYIGPRYLADFVPLLVLASAVGMADIWRRMDGRSGRRRTVVAGIVVALAAASVVINTGIAITPTEQWTQPRVLAYVQAQKAVSDALGGQLRGNVVRSGTLPERAPADQLRIIGDCDALYISNGEDYSTDPVAAARKQTWQVVQYGPALERTFYVTPRPSAGPTDVPLVRAGAWTVIARSVPQPGGATVLLNFPVVGSGARSGQALASIKGVEPVGGTHRVVVLTDPYTHLVQVAIDGLVVTKGPLPDGSPVATAVPDGQASVTTGISVVDGTAGQPQPTLCRALGH